MKVNLNPHIKSRFNTTQLVMLDVIIALLPLVFVSILAYGKTAISLISVAVVSALLTDFIFSSILLKKRTTILDGSAIVTALLLSFTLSPGTPWFIVAFGSFAAILFGKIVWGGLGKNRFNPALVGREFIAVFFASTMTSPNIWKNNDLVNVSVSSVWNNLNETVLSEHFSKIIYKTSGALGEYSVLCIAIGGLYLLLRNRISWHIPFSLLTGFVLLLWITDATDLRFSIAGILLGTVFMATDMPSSPITKYGKLYYGFMIGICIYLFIIGGCSTEYMSYAILLMNGFSNQISQTFQPRVWGSTLDWQKRTEAIFMLTIKILAFALAIISLNYYGFTQYMVFIYLVYVIIKFTYSFSKQLDHTI